MRINDYVDNYSSSYYNQLDKKNVFNTLKNNCSDYTFYPYRKFDRTVVEVYYTHYEFMALITLYGYIKKKRKNFPCSISLKMMLKSYFPGYSKSFSLIFFLEDKHKRKKLTKKSQIVCYVVLRKYVGRKHGGI